MLKSHQKENGQVGKELVIVFVESLCVEEGGTVVPDAKDDPQDQLDLFDGRLEAHGSNDEVFLSNFRRMEELSKLIRNSSVLRELF